MDADPLAAAAPTEATSVGTRRVLDTLVDFNKWLGADAPTSSAYKTFQKLHPSAPALTSVLKYGKLVEVLAVAVRPRSPEAVEALRPRVLPSEQTRSRKLRARLSKPQSLTILRMTSGVADISSREIAGGTGMDLSTLRRWLKLLKEEGLIEPLVTRAQSRKQRYRITPAGEAHLKAVDARRVLRNRKHE
jgi:DNA-binding MarR family transcriptional regulator